MELLRIISDNIAITWLSIGVFFIILEAFGASGVGFLFGGLGAITLGGLLAFNVLSPTYDFILQITFFFLLTSIWAAILWIPLKKRRASSSKSEYNDIIGETATVHSKPLKKDKLGQVKWSGTIMNARLDNSSKTESAEVGQDVKIISKDGNTLIVS